MGFQRYFDPEIGAATAHACVNDGALQARTNYAFAVGTSSQRLAVEPGVYRAFLSGMPAGTVVAVKTGDSSVAAALPTSAGDESAAFPGNAAVTIRVLPDKPYVAAILSTGSGDLYLTQVVPL